MRTAWASSSAMPGDNTLEAALGHLVAITEHFAASSPIMSKSIASYCNTERLSATMLSTVLFPCSFRGLH